MEKLRQIALKAYDWTIGLGLSDVVVDGCVTKAPCGSEKAGRSPVDRESRASNILRSWMMRGSPSVLSPLRPTATTHRF
jgi:hypothetical protein